MVRGIRTIIACEYKDRLEGGLRKLSGVMEVFCILTRGLGHTSVYVF